MLHPHSSGLLVVDIQGKLAHQVYGSEALLQSVAIVVKACQKLAVPVIVIEHNPEGLGSTVPGLIEVLDGVEIYKKKHFNAMADEGVRRAIKSTGRNHWLVCGIEAHICIYQTVCGLLGAGYRAEVLQDAVSSRRLLQKQIGLQRMQQSGADISCVEMALFELLEHFEHPEFRPVLKLIKSLPVMV